MSLLKLSLEPACTRGGFTPWLTRQGSDKAFTHGGVYASLLAHQLDGRLELADSLRMSARVRLAIIPSADEALCNLSTFAFVASHLFYTGGHHLSAIAELLHLSPRWV